MQIKPSFNRYQKRQYQRHFLLFILIFVPTLVIYIARYKHTFLFFTTKTPAIPHAVKKAPAKPVKLSTLISPIYIQLKNRQQTCINYPFCIKEKVITKETPPPTKTLGPQDAEYFITLNQGRPGTKMFSIKTYVLFDVLTIAQISHELKVTAPEPKVIQSAIKVNNKLVPYQRSLKVKVTAYSAEEIAKDSSAGNPTVTALGYKLKRGVIAAHPRVIPFYTCLYVPGYGFGKVLDTGGNIRNKRIDIAVDNTIQALRWGVKTLRVYVVDCKYVNISFEKAQ